MKEIKISGVDETVYEHTCSNGFKIYMWQYDLSPEIYMSINIKYGSLYTSFEVDNKVINVPNGIAHFLEHVKFNEKEGVTANNFYDKIGSYANAYTSYKQTTYEVNCDKDTKTNLEHLLYYVFNPYFTKELVEKEKGIIVEEARGSRNNAYSNGYYTLLENLFVNNNRRNIITGTPKEVESITLEDVKTVFDNFYLPDNSFLCIAGNIDKDEVVEIVEDYFKDKEFKKFNAKIIKPTEPVKVNKEYLKINDTINLPKAFVAYKFPRDIFNNDNIEFRISLNRLLSVNFGSTSDFLDDLLSNQIVDDFTYFPIYEDDVVAIVFEMSAPNLEEGLKRLDEKMNNLTIDKEAFDRKRKVSFTNQLISYDRAGRVASDIAKDIFEMGRVVNDLKEIQEKLSIDDVREIASKINNKNKCIVEVEEK